MSKNRIRSKLNVQIKNKNMNQIKLKMSKMNLFNNSNGNNMEYIEKLRVIKKFIDAKLFESVKKFYVLPNEILLKIYEFLLISELLTKCCLVSKKWNELSMNEDLSLLPRISRFFIDQHEIVNPLFRKKFEKNIKTSCINRYITISRTYKKEKGTLEFLKKMISAKKLNKNAINFSLGNGSILNDIIKKNNLKYYNKNPYYGCSNYFDPDRNVNSYIDEDIFFDKMKNKHKHICLINNILIYEKQIQCEDTGYGEDIPDIAYNIYTEAILINKKGDLMNLSIFFYIRKFFFTFIKMNSHNKNLESKFSTAFDCIDYFMNYECKKLFPTKEIIPTLVSSPYCNVNFSLYEEPLDDDEIINVLQITCDELKYSSQKDHIYDSIHEKIKKMKQFAF